MNTKNRNNPFGIQVIFSTTIVSPIKKKLSIKLPFHLIQFKFNAPTSLQFKKKTLEHKLH